MSNETTNIHGTDIITNVSEARATKLLAKRKPVASMDNPFILELLTLFGLKSWDNSDQCWSLEDIQKIIPRYMVLRKNLLDLSFPMDKVKKLYLNDPSPKDINTLLNQIGSLYGYKIESQAVTKSDPLTHKLSAYRMYRLVKLTPQDTQST